MVKESWIPVAVAAALLAAVLVAVLWSAVGTAVHTYRRAPAPRQAARCRGTRCGGDRGARHAFRDGMRRLWMEHVWWTREVIQLALARVGPGISVLGDAERGWAAGALPGLGAALERLLRNQADIGAHMAVAYGAAAGRRVGDLLVPHITLARDIILELGDAAAEGRAPETDALREAWSENARDVAEALAALRWDWDAHNILRDFLEPHLDMTATEALLAVPGAFGTAAPDPAAGSQYEQAVRHFDDAVQPHMLRFADFLAR